MKLTKETLKQIINETVTEMQDGSLNEALSPEVRKQIIPKIKQAYKLMKEVDKLTKGAGTPLFMKNQMLKAKHALEATLKKLGVLPGFGR